MRKNKEEMDKAIEEERKREIVNNLKYFNFLYCLVRKEVKIKS